MKAVILAGGLGTRLRPFTEIIPKPLLPLGERSLMEIQLMLLKEHGFDKIFIATNYKADYVEAYLGNGSKWGVEIVFSREEEPLGTCGPLSLLREQLDTPFLLINGDILTRLNFAAMMAAAEASEAAVTIGTKIVALPFRFGNVEVDSRNMITGIVEKPDLHFEILAGVYAFKPSAFELIPDKQYFGIDDLIKTMLSRKAPIGRYLIREYWLDIGQVEDYEKARKAVEDHF